MKCFFCNKDFEERKIEESHDVPCYLFNGIGISKSLRRRRKQEADKWGRHWLCRGEETNKCHETYEEALRLFLQKQAKEFANEYFKSRGDTNGLLC